MFDGTLSHDNFPWLGTQFISLCVLCMTQHKVLMKYSFSVHDGCEHERVGE